MRRRIKNIIRRMCDKQDFYTNHTPRITYTEIEEVEKATGCLLQSEDIYGAESGSPRAVYPLFYDKFKESASKIIDGI